MDKPFKTIEQQIEILESRGVIITPDTPSALEREGYYSIINGYKDLFLDRHAMGSSKDDVFYLGTSFDDIYGLYKFDRDLRQIMFRYFAIAEATLKTQCAYHFSKRHQSEPEPYMNIENYSPEANRRHVEKLLGDFKVALGRDPKKKPKKKEYLEHYLNKHDEVPLWVLLRYMTLGQAFMFYCFQDESMQNSIAYGFASLHDKSYDESIKIMPKQLRLAYDHIKDFRNICAHDERLYCARVSPGHDISIANVLFDLRLVLARDDYAEMTTRVINLLLQMGTDMKSERFAELMSAMGLKTIQDIVNVR